MTASRPNAALDRRVEERAALLMHELRTPLAIILGYVELLETRDDEKTRVEAPQRIREATKRLDSLIGTLVAASATAVAGTAILDRLPPGAQ